MGGRERKKNLLGFRNRLANGTQRGKRGKKSGNNNNKNDEKKWRGKRCMNKDNKE